MIKIRIHEIEAIAVYTAVVTAFVLHMLSFGLITIEDK